MPYTLQQLEAFVSSPHYDSATAGLIARGIPALKAADGELISPGVRRIRGNLCNVHGRYGPCDKAPSGGKKPKGGKRTPRGAKPKQTPAQQAEARAASRQSNIDSVAKRMAESDTGLSPSGSAALTAFAQGTQPSPQIGAGLAQMGLAEQASDGSYRMTPTGRAVVSAMAAGDYQRAIDGISRATDAAGKRGQRQTAAQARQAAAAERTRQAEAKRQARAALQAKPKPAKSSAGGSKKPEQALVEKPRRMTKRPPRNNSGGSTAASGSPSATPKPKPAPEPKPEQAPAKQIAPALMEAAQLLSDGAQLSDTDALALIRNGLAKLDKNDMLVLTAAGMRATQKTVRPVDIYDSATWRMPIATKAQTAQDRAMFAKMGGGGSGGGGSGGSSGGVAGSSKGGEGQSTLWPKGPSGKRTPQAAAAQTRAGGGTRQRTLPGTGPEFQGGKRTPQGGEGKGRAADVGKPTHGQTVGAPTKAFGNDPNKSYAMRHELVDMGDIQASNTANGGINPKYDASLQPRDRSRASSQAQIADVAQNMNPEVMTTDFHRIDAGSPIIDKNGNVLSGNGRTLALQRAAELHPDKYDAYKAEIKAKAREAGIDPAAVDKMKNPVLVRRLEGDHDTAAFAREANSSGTLRMSPLEQAKVDAGQIGDRHMLKLNVTENGDIDRALRDKSNKPFIDEFLAGVPDNERANLLTRNGDLNQMGLYRVKAAVYTRAFPGAAGERMAESMLESLDPDVKTIQNGISGALPAFSRATSLTRSGLRDRDLDISHDIAKSVDIYARIKDNPHLTANTPANQLVAKYLGQASMFDRELNGDQERLLVHIDKISRKPTEVRSFMERYAKLVEDAPQPGQASLFGAGDRLSRARMLDLLLGDATESMPDTQVGMF